MNLMVEGILGVEVPQWDFVGGLEGVRGKFRCQVTSQHKK